MPSSLKRAPGRPGPFERTADVRVQHLGIPEALSVVAGGNGEPRVSDLAYVRDGSAPSRHRGLPAEEVRLVNAADALRQRGCASADVPCCVMCRVYGVEVAPAASTQQTHVRGSPRTHLTTLCRSRSVQCPPPCDRHLL